MLPTTYENYYEILDVSPDATDTEIKSAYFRAKNAYSKDSVATYTLFDQAEITSILQRIEEAYLVLSNPEKRRTYDANQMNHGASLKSSLEESGFKNASEQNTQQDETPKNLDSGMAELPGYDDNESVFEDFNSGEEEDDKDSFQPSQSPTRYGNFEKYEERPGSNSLSKALGRRNQIEAREELDDVFEKQVEEEKDFRGPFLRKIREKKQISIEEIADHTKVSKSYLSAIEEENFKKLPATIYVRGFIQQYAKILKLDPQKATDAYTKRLKDYRQKEQNSIKKPEPKSPWRRLTNLFSNER
jgi:curved DNA-binding protein CbpA